MRFLNFLRLLKFNIKHKKLRAKLFFKVFYWLCNLIKVAGVVSGNRVPVDSFRESMDSIRRPVFKGFVS
jgi:hypothetical protein